MDLNFSDPYHSYDYPNSCEMRFIPGYRITYKIRLLQSLYCSRPSSKIRRGLRPVFGEYTSSGGEKDVFVVGIETSVYLRFFLDSLFQNDSKGVS